MATGYNIMLPSGSVWKAVYSSDEQRQRIIQDLLDRWSPYCVNNWCSANADAPFSPESKVKMFLSSLGYFWLSGRTNGIITYYKDVMNKKRQIPFASCPVHFADEAYGLTHNGCASINKAQDETFKSYIKNMDDRTKQIFGKQIPKIKASKETCRDRIMAWRNKNPDGELTRCIVQSDGIFKYEDGIYEINTDVCWQYAGKETAFGMLYDMDYIYHAVNDHGMVEFFDADFKRMPDDAVTCLC